MIPQVEVVQARDGEPFVQLCPRCRASPARLWVLTESGPILSGARFEACEGCAVLVSEVVVHRVALISTGAPLRVRE